MLHQLRRRRPPSGPVDLLTECHERIRYFLNLAMKIADAEDAPPADIQQGAYQVRRYIVEALPLHVADEEDLIAPLLRGCDETVEVALSRMVKEHRSQEEYLGQLQHICDVLEASPQRLPELRIKLRAVSATLSNDVYSHLADEERIIFPAMLRYLAAHQLDSILAAMRERRVQHFEREKHV
ncbi:MAG: hemerythrin domain-containing protein [Polyangiaceae bacterium]